MDESFGSGEPSPRPSPSGQNCCLRRETKSEVVLVLRLREALERLNPTLPADAISFAITELARDRSAMSLAAANREIWGLLRKGVNVSLGWRLKVGARAQVRLAIEDALDEGFPGHTQKISIRQNAVPSSCMCMKVIRERERAFITWPTRFGPVCNDLSPVTDYEYLSGSYFSNKDRTCKMIFDRTIDLGVPAEILGIFDRGDTRG